MKTRLLNKRVSAKLIIFLILILILVIGRAGVAEKFDEKAELYKREEKLLTQIEDKPSALLYWQLARLRLRLAAYHYDNYRDKDSTLYGSPAEMENALTSAVSVTELAPDWDEGWLMWGMLLAEFKADQSMMARATEALIKAVELNPANGRAQILLARVLMEQGRFWSAIEQYKSLFAKDESMITGINLSSLTLAYIADGRVQAGLDYMFRLAVDYPENIGVNICLAILYKHNGDLDIARLYLKTLLEKAPLSQDEKVYIESLLKSWEGIKE